MTSHLLELNTWQSVEAYLERSRVILIPIGSTEQHGPNGLIGTDFITAQAIARGAGEKAGILVAPTINVGMAMHHMAFPGTITLRPETLMAVLRDNVTSLYRHGFRGLVFVNGHGGNIATARAAISGLNEELPDVAVSWINWYMVPPVRKLCRELYGDREGSHATPSEVAVTMAVHPEHVRTIEGPMDLESCRLRGIAGSETFRQWYPDGRMASDPSMARPEHGHKLLEAAIVAIAERVTQIDRDIGAASGH